MADSIRQDIAEAIDTRLKTIKTTAGYKTNAGTNVFDWIDRDLADSELDAIIYRDTLNDLEIESFGRSINQIRVEIEGKTKSTTTTAKQCRLLIEDIYKAISTDETWGGLALQTQPVSDEIEVRMQDKIMGTARIVVNIMYESARWAY